MEAFGEIISFGVIKTACEVCFFSRIFCCDVEKITGHAIRRELEPGEEGSLLAFVIAFGWLNFS